MQNVFRRYLIGCRTVSVLALCVGTALAGTTLVRNASAKPEASAAQPAIGQGQKVYMQARCFACHGEYGFGGVGPRFRQDHFLGLSDYVVGQILVGRGVMPSFARTLNDKQIADVASYIRDSWGNHFGSLKPQEVAQTRNQLKERRPTGPHVSSSQQPAGIPVPPSGGQSPGQPLPPPAVH